MSLTSSLPSCHVYTSRVTHVLRLHCMSATHVYTSATDAYMIRQSSLPSGRNETHVYMSRVTHMSTLHCMSRVAHMLTLHSMRRTHVYTSATPVHMIKQSSLPPRSDRSP